ncbi:hypothetical protein BBUCA112A_KI0028 (plasmid) [Borreliella burgdorferi CA-11.2A]|nr:hypothetical protein BBUCA112A_KI0028 [Borreliella burgdorferi CA-11.2A]
MLVSKLELLAIFYLNFFYLFYPKNYLRFLSYITNIDDFYFF